MAPFSRHEVLVFRHGETDWNHEGRFQGHLDIPINPRGRSQAQGLVARINGHGVQAILSSDLMRAYETGRIVANALGLPVFMDPGLREAHLGQAQGLLREEIEARFGCRLERWKSNLETDADVSYPGGETGLSVMSRVFAAMEKFLVEYPDFERIAVSTHGGVIRRMMQRILPPGQSHVPIPNAVVYRLIYEPSARAWSTAPLD